MVRCLNPYSNGIRIEPFIHPLKNKNMKSLNPYSNGIRIELRRLVRLISKLCLNPYSNGIRIEHDYENNDSVCR